ncbi:MULTISPECIES: phage holin family protein [Streptomyces]|uniref:phage holin family protein n=1 Tax=Streptomyces TaxID=1883 RepID=UPI001E3B07D0|nr:MULTISPECIES: phage holin family protein [Streptomyces]UFQ19963.1 phage holin family protein [Streptomyces huasconensis]WCL89584.1 phage holin family protein [Streptomyces sp. JCM 35825]
MATQFPDPVGTGAEHRTAPRSAKPGDPSIGDLLSEISTDVSQLVRDEIELAKAEIKQESTKAGKAVGMLGGAGYAGHLALLLGSLTVIFALSHVMDIAWAALIVTAVWAVVAAVLYKTGRTRLRTVNLKPEQTVETLKEDAQWARHPTS